MQTQDIQEIIDLQSVLAPFGLNENADLIGGLMVWRHADDGRADIVATVVDKQPKAKRGKTTGTDVPEEDKFEASPDPSSDEPDF